MVFYTISSKYPWHILASLNILIYRLLPSLPFHPVNRLQHMGCCLYFPLPASGAKAAPLLYLHRQAGALLLSVSLPPTLPHGTTHWMLLLWQEHKECLQVAQGSSIKPGSNPRHWEYLNRPLCCTSCTFLAVAEIVATPWNHPVSSAPKCYTGTPVTCFTHATETGSQFSTFQF